MNDVYLIRGDSKKIRFKRTDCKGNVIKEKPDKMYFSVKYSDDDTAPLLFQKTLDNGITYDDETNYYFIEIQPKDTNGLPYINLFYDVEIKVGDYTKTIAKGQIKLDGEVTHAKDEEQVVEIVSYEDLNDLPKINGVELKGDLSLEDLSINIPDVSNFITKEVDDLTNYTKTEDLEQEYAKKDEIPSTDGFITKSVKDLDNYTTTTNLEKNYIKNDNLETEIQDLLQGLERNLDEENKAKTSVYVRNKIGGKELIMEIDDLDKKSEIATNRVLGAIKGEELNNRISTLEKTPIQVIELSSEMSSEEKSSHTYPQLQLSEEQVKVVLNNNISILKVNYNITGLNNKTETDTLVFYTTIDDEKVTASNNVVDTIKINAIRRNNEGILVYHGEMVGNGKEYYEKVTLEATWKE